MGRKLLAWGVHIFTATGVIVGLLALVAIVNRDFRAALLLNFVVFYIFVLGLIPVLNVVIIAVFCCLHFTPIDFIYPTRTIRFKRLTFSLVLLLAAVNLTILIQHPARNSALLTVSLVIVGYLMVVSLYQTYLGRRGIALP